MKERTMIIREFCPEDADAISTLIRTTMLTSNAGDYSVQRLQPLIDYFSPEKMVQLGQERCCLVAEKGGDIVGTVSLEPIGDQVCAQHGELCTFFVHPDHQRTGVGTELLTAIEEIAKESGISCIQVDSSITGTLFYQRRGYLRTSSNVEGTAGVQVGLKKTLSATKTETQVIK